MPGTGTIRHISILARRTVKLFFGLIYRFLIFKPSGWFSNAETMRQMEALIGLSGKHLPYPSAFENMVLRQAWIAYPFYRGG